MNLLLTAPNPKISVLQLCNSKRVGTVLPPTRWGKNATVNESLFGEGSIIKVCPLPKEPNFSRWGYGVVALGRTTNLIWKVSWDKRTEVGRGKQNDGGGEGQESGCWSQAFAFFSILFTEGWSSNNIRGILKLSPFLWCLAFYGTTLFAFNTGLDKISGFSSVHPTPQCFSSPLSSSVAFSNWSCGNMIN